MKMADVIVKYRKEKGMTQKQLADRLGVTNKAVSKWECGNGYPDINYLVPLAEILDITVIELLQGKAPGTVLETKGGEACDEQSIKMMLGYAKKTYETNYKNVSRLAILTLLILGIVGIITTAIVDFTLNSQFTWSLFSISSIIFSWLCIIPLYLCRKYAIEISLLFTSIFIFPFLYIIETITRGSWFVTLAVPTAIVGVITLWVVRIVFATKMSILNKLAVCSLIGVGVNIVMTFMIAKLLDDVIFDQWDALSLAVLIGITLALIIVARGVKNK